MDLSNGAYTGKWGGREWPCWLIDMIPPFDPLRRNPLFVSMPSVTPPTFQAFDCTRFGYKPKPTRFSHKVILGEERRFASKVASPLGMLRIAEPLPVDTVPDQTKSMIQVKISESFKSAPRATTLPTGTPPSLLV